MQITTVNVVNDLRQLSTNNFSLVQTLGQTSVGDGNARRYLANLANTAADNGTTIIAPVNNNGRFIDLGESLNNPSFTGTVTITGATVNLTGSTVTGLTGAEGASMVLITSSNANNSATIDFTTGIDSTYKVYKIICSAILPATNAAVPELLFSTNGGSTWDTTSSYMFAGLYAADNNTNGQTNSGGVTTTQISLWAGGAASASTKGVNFEITLYNPSSASAYKQLSCAGVLIDGTGNGISVNLMGQYRNATAVNAVRFLFSAGNIASGNISFYGLRNA